MSDTSQWDTYTKDSQEFAVRTITSTIVDRPDVRSRSRTVARDIMMLSKRRFLQMYVVFERGVRAWCSSVVFEDFNHIPQISL